jgi:uncharacterized protein YdaT
MSSHKHNDVFVVQHGNKWAVKKPNAERASAVTDTQQEALARAKEIAGRGSVHVQGRNGKFRNLTPFDN